MLDPQNLPPHSKNEEPVVSWSSSLLDLFSNILPGRFRPSDSLSEISKVTQIFESVSPMEWNLSRAGKQRICTISRGKNGSATLTFESSSSSPTISVRNASFTTTGNPNPQPCNELESRALEKSVLKSLMKLQENLSRSASSLLTLLSADSQSLLRESWYPNRKAQYPEFETTLLGYELKLERKSARVAPVPTNLGGPGEGVENDVKRNMIIHEYMRENNLRLGDRVINERLAMAGCSYWVASQDYVSLNVKHRSFSEVLEFFNLHQELPLAQYTNLESDGDWVKIVYDALCSIKR